MKRLLNWTLKSKVGFSLLLGLGFLGCNQKPVLVYIDIDQCIPEEQQVISTYLKSIEVNFPAQKIVFPALPADTTFEQTDLLRREKLNEIINKNLDKSFKSLLREIQDSYDHELEQIRLSRRQELREKRQEISDFYYSKVRNIFMRYAPEHGKCLWQLAQEVGFPDPDPYSSQPQFPKSNQERKKIKNTLELRKEIHTCNNLFRKDIQEIVNQIQNFDQKQKQELIDEIQQLREKSHAKAFKQAQTIIKELTEQIKVLQKTDYSLTLPSLNQKQYFFPSIKKKFFSKPEKKINRGNPREFYYAQAALWAKQQGYQLVDRPSQGKNKTQDFIKWKKQYELDPVTNR